MNRCSRPILASRSRTRRPIALFLALVPLLAAAWFASPARAQEETLPPTEASFGGRNFPVNTLRGRFKVVAWPEIELDGQAERLSPGSRIRNEQQMLVMPAAITGQQYLVNYTRDAAGLVREVWILTPDEARAKRATADRPFLNFWPFASRAARDDGNTPYDQLPGYGQ